MHLIEIFLPLSDNQGKRFPREDYLRVEKELAEEFGGVTAYPRTPASGLWKQGGGEQRDDLVIYEILAETVDEQWWNSYRHKLEQQFSQDEILIRSHECRKL